MLDPSIAIELLLSGSPPTLWNTQTQRETCRFLRIQGKSLNDELLNKITSAIVNGPPRSMFREDISDADWHRRKDRETWLLLSKLNQSGAELPEDAKSCLMEIIARYPEWKLDNSHSEEFPFYVSSGWREREKIDIDFDQLSLLDLQKWASDEEARRWDLAGWDKYCDHNPENALERLVDLSEFSAFPKTIWDVALWRFTENKEFSKKNSERLGTAVLNLPLDVIGHIHVSAARWLKATSSELSEATLLRVWKHIWNGSKSQHEQEIPTINTPLNHGSGILADVLISSLASDHPSVRANGTYDILPSYQELLDLVALDNSYGARLARLSLSNQLLYLFRLTPKWTRECLIHRMNPASADFDETVWTGYLWSANISEDLLKEIKPSLIKVLKEPQHLVESDRQRAVDLFIIVAIPPRKSLTTDEARAVLDTFSAEQLSDAARALSRMQANAGNKSDTQWTEIVGPWFSKAWPKKVAAQSSDVSDNLAWMAIESGRAFPEVIETIKDILVPVNSAGVPLHRLMDSGLHRDFPIAARSLVARIAPDPNAVLGNSYAAVMSEIEENLR
ncbi:MAG: hypothetical protein ACMZ66_07790 [Thalassospira sp.]|uniref:hypothetical protein n=1 Tax=Thalassospira sp. TaxID=1912094 RepID=UPI003A85C29E